MKINFIIVVYLCNLCIDLLIVPKVNSLSLLEDNIKNPTQEYKNICGWTWQQEYMQHHHDIISGKKPGKYIIAVPVKAGLADVIHGYISAFLWALLSNRAFLILRVPQLDDKTQRSIEFGYSSPFIKWTAPFIDRERYRCLLPPYDSEDSKHCIGEPRSKILSYFYRICGWKYGPYLKMNNKDYTFTIASGINGDGFLQDFNMMNLADVKKEYDVIFTSSNRGSTYKAFNNPKYRDILHTKYNLTQSTAFSCLFHYLFKPLPEVCPLHSGCDQTAKKLQHIDKDPHSISIAMHIRTPEMGEYGEHFHCMESLLRYYQKIDNYKVYILLVTTNIDIQRKLMKMHGHKLLLPAGNISKVEVVHDRNSGESAVSYTEEQIAALDRQGVIDSARDYYMLSLAQIHILSPRSGFGVIGAMSRLSTQHVMYRMEYEEGVYRKRNCNATLHGDDLSVFANEWSGL